MDEVTRIGECNRCGLCCLGCTMLVMEFKHTPSGLQAYCSCKEYGNEYYLNKGCKVYPSYPDRVMGKICGYRFIDKDGKDITEYRQNPVILVMYDKCIIRRDDNGIS